MGNLKNAMRKSKHRRPPTLHVYTSRDTSPRCSSVLSDCDADDEGLMSLSDGPSRPLSLAIPPGPFFIRRPTLQEVLANEAPPPWTLSAFTAYLSQNHCLETLEFTSDAKRYYKHYREMLERNPLMSPDSQENEYVRMLWSKLLDAYITPNGAREVNLPSDVRDRLLALDNTYKPPDPLELDEAVKIVFDLMDESVLVNFVNSFASREPDSSNTDLTSSQLMDAYLSGSVDERSLSPARARNRKDRSPPLSAVGSDHFKPGAPSRMSQLSAGISRVSRLSQHFTGSSGASSSEAPDSMTDDTDSTSPSTSALEPMTPPNSPPTSDLSPGKDAAWKKMGSKLGFNKSRSHGSSPSMSNSRFRSKDEEGGVLSP